jgi:hypothetical protein
VLGSFICAIACAVLGAIQLPGYCSAAPTANHSNSADGNSAQPAEEALPSRHPILSLPPAHSKAGELSSSSTTRSHSCSDGDAGHPPSAATSAPANVLALAALPPLELACALERSRSVPGQERGTKMRAQSSGEAVSGSGSTSPAPAPSTPELSPGGSDGGSSSSSVDADQRCSPGGPGTALSRTSLADAFQRDCESASESDLEPDSDGERDVDTVGPLAHPCVSALRSSAFVPTMPLPAGASLGSGPTLRTPGAAHRSADHNIIRPRRRQLHARANVDVLLRRARQSNGALSRVMAERRVSIERARRDSFECARRGAPSGAHARGAAARHAPRAAQRQSVLKLDYMEWQRIKSDVTATFGPTALGSCNTSNAWHTCAGVQH